MTSHLQPLVHQRRRSPESPERVSVAVVPVIITGFAENHVRLLGEIPQGPRHVPLRGRVPLGAHVRGVPRGLPARDRRPVRLLRPWAERAFLLTFVFGFGATWCLAAAGVLYQIRIANYMLWFYALGAAVECHLTLRLSDHQGGYFPGAYTAADHLVMSALLIGFLLQESGRLRAAACTQVRT
jgi:hypothetical protein